MPALSEQKWTHTCCWTDHSNGCPAKEVPVSECNETKPGLASWYRRYHGARVRMGYEDQKSEAEILKSIDFLWKWQQEDEKRMS